MEDHVILAYVISLIGFGIPLGEMFHRAGFNTWWGLLGFYSFVGVVIVDRAGEARLALAGHQLMGNFSPWHWLIGLMILVLPLISIPTFCKAGWNS